VAILKVARMGHPVLREVCRDLSPEEIGSDRIRRLVSDMRETMDEYRGVGIAAPQVHEPIRIALIEFGADNPRYDVGDPQPLVVLFNAHVTVIDATPSGYWEGCLSLPGLRGFVERPRKVQVDYLDEKAEPRQVTAEGFLATVCQHELDHLDGVLYVDRIRDPAKLTYVEEFERFHSGQPVQDTDE
jgi:peptide deformylase